MWDRACEMSILPFEWVHLSAATSSYSSSPGDAPSSSGGGAPHDGRPPTGLLPAPARRGAAQPLLDRPALSRPPYTDGQARRDTATRPGSALATAAGGKEMGRRRGVAAAGRLEVGVPLLPRRRSGEDRPDGSGDGVPLLSFRADMAPRRRAGAPASRDESQGCARAQAFSGVESARAPTDKLRRRRMRRGPSASGERGCRRLSGGACAGRSPTGRRRCVRRWLSCPVGRKCRQNKKVIKH
jgi:hypothetical protein